MPHLFFEVIQEPAAKGEQYEFTSVEIKQTAFRIDGLFIPKPGSHEKTVIFVECQFQKDEVFYGRLFSEVMLYLRQHPEVEDWRAVVIYPRRGVEPERRRRYQLFFESGQCQVVYLEDYLELSDQALGIQLMQLIVAKEGDTQNYLNQLVQRFEGETDPKNGAIMEMISTIMVYKFPELSREAIQAMFTVSDVKKTRVYRDAREEGRVEGLERGLEQGLAQGLIKGETALVLRQLSRRFGVLSKGLEAQIQGLSLEQVEALGEALLDFEGMQDLQQWLKQQA